MRRAFRPGDARSAPPSAGGRRALPAAWVVPALLGLWVPGAAAYGQSRPYYNITAIEATPLPNGVIVTIRADGAMTDAHAHDWNFLANGEPMPVRTLPLQCSNGKSQVGDFVDISLYPVSHVELTPRSWTNDGIGVDIAVQLYTDARIRHFRTSRLAGDWEWDPSMGCCFDGEMAKDQQSFVYTVISDRFRTPDPPTEPLGPTDLSLTREADGTFSLDATNADLQDVARTVGQATGAQLLVDASVGQRHVTAHLPQMAVPELLSRLAEGYGLALEQRAGSFVLTKGLPADVATYDTNVTQVVPLTQLSAGAALALLPNFLLTYVRPSEAQNALIVAGPPQLAERVRADVARIDRPPTQIRVAVTAVKVATTGSWRQAWNLRWAQDQDLLVLDPSGGDLTYQHLAEPLSQIHAFLRALQQQGAVRTLARAHIALTNGKWARLFLGQEKYIQVTRNTEIGSEQVAVPVSLGVDMRLSAWTGGRDIVLHVQPVVTSLGGVDPTSDLPIVDRYEAQSALRVRDGETLLLGGIHLDSDLGTATGLPRPTPHGGHFLLPAARTDAREQSEIALFVTASRMGGAARPDDDAAATLRRLGGGAMMRLEAAGDQPTGAAGP